MALLVALPALAQEPASAPASAGRWVPVPPAGGRLRAAQIGLVINDADPYSVEIGEYYQRRRGLAPEQVLHVELPVHSALKADELEALQRRIGEHFGPATQALALAWTRPYAVQCQSITGALALGFDAELCQRSCAPSRPSPYFNSASARPFTDHALRPSMLLAADTVEGGKALIDRGIAADGSLRWRARPPASAMFLTTDDAPRRVRMALYPPPGPIRARGVDVRVAPATTLLEAQHVLLAITGSVRPDLKGPVDWLAGALADHLTSFGGALDQPHGQGTALDWLRAGATASHGTVSEPCNHLQKFPHPQVLLLHYLQGETAIEAYWKSVAWPQQGLFIGEPLAAPFGTP
jgi:uncharacterized protein (TIGR03790 family)